jgi:hypothetical protein
MEKWKTTLRVGSNATQLLMMDPFGNDLLKACLPRPEHPRALLTMLEGLALWAGTPITVAVHVAASCPRMTASTLFGDDLLPVDSALVRLDFRERPAKTGRRLSGVGDFRHIRRLASGEL